MSEPLVRVRITLNNERFKLFRLKKFNFIKLFRRNLITNSKKYEPRIIIIVIHDK